MRFRHVRLVLCFAAVAALSACARSVTENIIEDAAERETGENVDVDIGTDGTARVETDEGTFTTGSGLPENWPTDVPTYAGAEVIFAGTANPASGAPGFGASLVSSDPMQNVWAFYERSLAENGWTVNARVQSGETNLLGAEKDGRSITVMLGGSDGQTAITIGIEEEKRQ